MAEIFLAKQSGPAGFEKLVVIKRVLPHLVGNENFVHMFLDEARIAARLNHPGIVQIFDFGEAEGSYFLAMEYLSGEDLVSLLKVSRERTGEGLPAIIAARIISAACDALFYAHTFTDDDGRPLNIVHRDISPSNIFLTYQGAVKVLDFGIAKAEGKLVQTQGGILKGKFLYMSPEQISGKGLDARADLFALGAVLHELVTGAPTFMRENELGMLKAITEEPVTPLLDLVPGIAAEYDAITLKALAKDPQQRYQTANELRRALDSFVARTSSASATAQLQEYIQGLVPADVIRQKLRPITSPGSKVMRRADGGIASMGSGTRPKPVPADGTDSTALRPPSREAVVAAVRRPLTNPQLDPTLLDAQTQLRPPSDPAATLRDSDPEPQAPDVEVARPTLRNVADDQAAAGLKGSRLPALLGVAVVVVGLAGGGYWLVTRKPDTVAVVSVPEPLPAPKPPEVAVPAKPQEAPKPIDDPKPKDPVVVADSEVPAKPAPDPKPTPTADPATAPKPTPPRTSVVAVVDKPVPADAKKPTVASKSGKGTLDVNCVPWCHVYVDGKDTGQNSPARGIALSPGKHRLKVVNPPSALEKEVEVEIRSGESATKVVRF